MRVRREDRRVPTRADGSPGPVRRSRGPVGHPRRADGRRRDLPRLLPDGSLRREVPRTGGVAFPTGETTLSAEVPGTTEGFTFAGPIASGLWYACERCRQHVKADRRADLAPECGYPAGSNRADTWQAFRGARLPGPGYAWPLVTHKLPTAHKKVRDAWEEGKLAFADHVRERLRRPAPPRGRQHAVRALRRSRGRPMAGHESGRGDRGPVRLPPAGPHRASPPPPCPAVAHRSVDGDRPAGGCRWETAGRVWLRERSEVLRRPAGVRAAGAEMSRVPRPGPARSPCRPSRVHGDTGGTIGYYGLAGPGPTEGVDEAASVAATSPAPRTSARPLP